jgi:hypothetical protein
VICDKCGWELRVGDWPFCGTGRDHQPGNWSAIGDEIPGGFVQENFGHAPETFYSKKAMALRAKKLGLVPMVRHVDGDKHVSRWV